MTDEKCAEIEKAFPFVKYDPQTQILYASISPSPVIEPRIFEFDIPVLEKAFGIKILEIQNTGK